MVAQRYYYYKTHGGCTIIHTLLISPLSVRLRRMNIARPAGVVIMLDLHVYEDSFIAVYRCANVRYIHEYPKYVYTTFTFMEEECSMYARNPPQPPTSLCNEPYIWHKFLLCLSMTCRNIIMIMSETAEQRKIYKSLAEDMLPTELDALETPIYCKLYSSYAFFFRQESNDFIHPVLESTVCSDRSRSPMFSILMKRRNANH